MDRIIHQSWIAYDSCLIRYGLSLGVREICSYEKCSVVVKCRNITAEFYPAKLKKIGNSMAKCIKYCGKWYNSNEFLNLAGMQKSKKWKQSITENAWGVAS